MGQSLLNIPLKGLCVSIDAGDVPGGGTPDLRFDRETGLNMRYLGKQVYARLVDFGPLPNAGTKTVAHGIADADWLALDQTFSKAVNGPTVMPLNSPHPGSVSGSWTSWIDGEGISILTGTDRSMISAVCCVLYTKSGAQPLSGEA